MKQHHHWSFIILGALVFVMLIIGGAIIVFKDDRTTEDGADERYTFTGVVTHVIDDRTFEVYDTSTNAVRTITMDADTSIMTPNDQSRSPELTPETTLQVTIEGESNADTESTAIRVRVLGTMQDQARNAAAQDIRTVSTTSQETR